MKTIHILKKYFTIPLLLVITGCVDSDVKAVKDYKSDRTNGYTYGQILDDKDTCSEITWDAKKDVRGYASVDYVCKVKYTPEFIFKLKEKILEFSKTMQPKASEDISKDLENYVNKRKYEIEQVSMTQAGDDDQKRQYADKIELCKNSIEKLNKLISDFNEIRPNYETMLKTAYNEEPSNVDRYLAALPLFLETVSFSVNDGNVRLQSVRVSAIDPKNSPIIDAASANFEGHQLRYKDTSREMNLFQNLLSNSRVYKYKMEEVLNSEVYKKIEKIKRDAYAVSC